MPQMNASELERSILAIRLWMERRLLEGPAEMRGVNPPVHGHSHPSGHTAILIPDWELRQKLEVVKLAEQYISSMEPPEDRSARLIQFVRLMHTNIKNDIFIDPVKRAMYIGAFEVSIAEFEGKPEPEVAPMGGG